MNREILQKEAESKGKKAPHVALIPTPNKVMKEKKTATLTTVLTVKNKEKLKQLSKESGLSISELISFWIENS